MYAEALNELGTLDAAAWNRSIRSAARTCRVYGSSRHRIPGGAKEQLRDIVRRERRAELAFEGLRIFDIRRWKIAETVLNRPVRGIKVSSGAFNRDPKGYIIVENRAFTNPKHYLWPVPTFETDQNKNLGQNTGW